MVAFVSEGITERNLHELYADPYIQRVGHDHRPAAPIFHPSARYFSAWVDDDFSGAFLLIKTSPIDCDVHSLLMRRCILESRDLGDKFLEHVFMRNDFDRVTAPVIEGLEAARNFCLKLGFKQEGFKRDACQKDGILRGIHIMGMTRKDWSEL